MYPVTATIRALLIDDDAKLARLLGEYLGGEGISVTHAADGPRGLLACAKGTFDVVLLDLMLPGMDGLSVCQKLRQQGRQVPIVMLTARGEETDRIVGLEMGADDYLPKPFNPRELLARINAVLRRQASAQAASSIEGASTLAFEGWRIDLRLRELRNPEGARVAVTSAEFDLLRTFCERPGRVLSRDSLLDLTQGRNTGSFERSIDVLVSRIRRKIEPNPADPTIIKTVRSGGYLFTPRTEAVTTPLSN
jgi:two-component system OmpR family response regulator